MSLGVQEVKVPVEVGVLDDQSSVPDLVLDENVDPLSVSHGVGGWLLLSGELFGSERSLKKC